MYKYIILLLLLFSVVNNNNCIFLIQSYTFFSITNLIIEIMATCMMLMKLMGLLRYKRQKVVEA